MSKDKNNDLVSVMIAASAYDEKAEARWKKVLYGESAKADFIRYCKGRQRHKSLSMVKRLAVRAIINAALHS